MDYLRKNPVETGSNYQVDINHINHSQAVRPAKGGVGGLPPTA